MAKKFLLSFGIIVLVFTAYVASRPGKFKVERSAVVNASPSKIFPYLSSFKRGSEWSPYEKIDPNMKTSYSGPAAGVGATMQFSGNNKVGEGQLEILKVIPNSLVEIRLAMVKPLSGINIIQYRLSPEGSSTRFSWSMVGDRNFLSKLVGIFIDCEKMVGDQFEQGIRNLKLIVENHKDPKKSKRVMNARPRRLRR